MKFKEAKEKMEKAETDWRAAMEIWSWRRNCKIKDPDSMEVVAQELEDSYKKYKKAEMDFIKSDD